MGLSAPNIKLIRQAFVNSLPVIQFGYRATTSSEVTIYKNYLDLTDIDYLRGAYKCYIDQAVRTLTFKLIINGTTYLTKAHTGTTNPTWYNLDETLAAGDKGYVEVEMTLKHSSGAGYLSDLTVYNVRA